MMYAKLALRNVRRTARDYLIYVVTLVLSVGMFYGFFSLVSPYYNATLPVPIHLDVLKKMMRIAVPLVGLFVVFLMSYVNSYTPVLADRSRGQVLPFSTCSVPSQTHIISYSIKKGHSQNRECPKNTNLYSLAPCVGISQQVQRVRF